MGRESSDDAQMSDHPESSAGESSDEYEESEHEGSSQDEREDSDLEMLADTIKSKNSGLTYDLKKFTPAARRRFHAGMAANCAVNFVQVSNVGDTAAVMFTVSENSTIRVGVPVNGGREARCTCPDQRDGRVCKVSLVLAQKYMIFPVQIPVLTLI